jgi:hypothetical protein
MKKRLVIVMAFLLLLPAFVGHAVDVQASSDGRLQSPTRFLVANSIITNITSTNLVITRNAIGGVSIVNTNSGGGEVTTAQLLAVSNKLQAVKQPTNYFLTRLATSYELPNQVNIAGAWSSDAYGTVQGIVAGDMGLVSTGPNFFYAGTEMDEAVVTGGINLGGVRRTAWGSGSGDVVQSELNNASNVVRRACQPTNNILTVLATAAQLPANTVIDGGGSANGNFEAVMLTAGEDGIVLGGVQRLTWPAGDVVTADLLTVSNVAMQRQWGSLNLTNWSGLATSWVSSVVAQATNSAQVTNWLSFRQPASELLSNLVNNPYTGYTNPVSGASTNMNAAAVGSLTITNPLLMMSMSNVPTPPTNQLYFASEWNYGDVDVFVVDSTSNRWKLAMAQDERTVVSILPDNGTTVRCIGALYGTAGTIAHPVPTEEFGNAFVLATANASNRYAHVQTTNMFFVGTKPGFNGFTYHNTFSITNSNFSLGGGGLSMFTGLCSQSVTNPALSHTNLQPAVGMCVDVRGRLSTNGFFWVNNGLGTSNSFDSGIMLSTSNIFRFTVAVGSQGRQAGFELVNLTTGKSTNAWITSGIPTNALYAGVGIGCRTNIISGMMVNRIYVEVNKSW